MKTKFLFIVILAITFTSCSSSGWSCKKRYVNKSNSEKLLEHKHEMSKKQNS